MMDNVRFRVRLKDAWVNAESESNAKYKYMLELLRLFLNNDLVAVDRFLFFRVEEVGDYELGEDKD